MTVIVVVKWVDVVTPVCTEIVQRLPRVSADNSDEVTSGPHLNADQHDVDAF